MDATWVEPGSPSEGWIADPETGLRFRPKLLLRGVSKIYATRRGQTRALHRINLTVRDGEFVCIIGPSGCGKSTLLNLVAGLDHYSEGEILADGKVVRGAGTDRLMIFQEPTLFPWLNVLGNIEFGLKMAGVPPRTRRERAEEALRLVHLLPFREAFVHELSGGMKQRVALARALVMDPQVLLMDEPFAALDTQTREMLHDELLSAWSQTRKTIIFVTHNIEEAIRLGDRVVVFSQRPGRIRRELRLETPRPRSAGLCVDLIGEISEGLRNEASIAAREEYGNEGEPERRHETDHVSCLAGDNLGSSGQIDEVGRIPVPRAGRSLATARRHR